MSIFVVDASVVIKWFIPEVHSAAARRFLEDDHQFFAPDLLFAELGNVIWKKVRGGQLMSAEGLRLVKDLANLAIETIPCRLLNEDAYSLATATGRTVYEALYLALAVRLHAQMITADERLANALAAVPHLAPHIRSIQSL